MVGSSRILLGVVVASLLTTSTARAFNGRFGLWRSPPSVSFYYVAPYVFCPPAPVVIPVPDGKPRTIFANPMAAPPSPTAEPPVQKKVEMPPAKTSIDPRMPVIVTAHTLGTGAALSKTPLAIDRVRVGFWNLSGRDVTLTVDGKAWALPKDRAVTLDLERQFAWQVEGRSQHVERVAEGQSTHEVVIPE